MYSKHYVYEHRTPDGRILNVGNGSEGRAWTITGRDGYHRDQLLSYTHDYVELTHTGLERHEALLIERKVIREEDPPANIQERIK